jgi:predicted component of type VI protein secretion system
MKVSLVVASGAHQGKVIPITGQQFLIGRDAQCHLRPASQAISKKHCGVLVRDGKVYIQDFGSTNGTTVNESLIKNAEIAVADGTALKLGPLDFTIRIEVGAPNPDGTPLPAASPETAAALAAVKAATGSAAAKSAGPVRDATPNPARATKPGGSKEAPALGGSKELAAPKSPAKPAAETPSPSSSTFDSVTDADHDRIAAMLLGMDDGAPVPDGSTVIDTPAVDGQGQPVAQAAGKSDEKAGKKPVQSREEMSNAAQDILRRMMRRPK